ncbi:ATP-binding protein [Psychrobacter faecalis]|uniref:ATP-binding protein n=1 Tax=Psychrobacter faecalis TaxID=180588 RepID=UPI003FD457FE
MTSDIKHTQLTRVGYSYQDFWCIKLLIDWFHQPDLYQWMTIENSESGPHKFIGLDDVVALNSYGKYELYQVKFTIDSERKDLSLSLDWLLKKKNNGSSLLQKWNTDFKKYYEVDLLAKAVLVTNRVPDSIVDQALTNEIIDLRLIPSEYLSKIYEQLGGTDEAKNFFKHFKFRHSQPTNNDLETSLRNSLVPDHTTDEGWYRFIKAVERWATTKNQPSLDGHIKLHHLKELFSVAISQSLSQFFEVPKGYLAPSKDFHQNILAKTKQSGAWVVFGRPGIGKSTYLSHLTNVLVEKGVPVLRHHYSILSQGEVDRVSYTNVARSILLQIKQVFPDLIKTSDLNHNDLYVSLKEACDRAEANNKQLVLIIDGLDHVSRERSGDISQLNHLINIVNKLKDRICIIYGTQPISNIKLPAIMEVDTPRDTHWFELPPMDMHAIRSWLNNLVASSQIKVVGDDEYRNSELSAINTAFHRVSSGYPLYLIYSIRKLATNKNHIIAYDVERLPICPDGDILKYYDVLWSNLSAQAREVLLQISCVEFSWPDRDTLATCFENTLSFTNAFDEIRHLFDIRLSGITPFHSSIIFYLKSKDEFTQQSKTLIKRAKSWLDTDAPEYWRWGWQWIIESYLGNPLPLLEGVNRDWLIDSVCKGYPNSHIERILYFAESTAFEQKKYSDLVKFRLIKMRHLDGPNFQIQDFSKFLKIAVENPTAYYAMLWRIDNLHTLSNQDISVVVSYSKSSPNILIRCFDELIKRIKFYAVYGDDQGNTIDALINSAFDCLLKSENPDITRVVWLLNKLSEKKVWFDKVTERLVSSGYSDIILDFPISSIPEDSLNMYWDNFVLACCDHGISFLDRPEREQTITSIYGSITATLEDNDFQIDCAQFTKPEPIVSFENMPYKRYIKLFFYYLAQSLSHPKATRELLDFTNSDITTFQKDADKFFEHVASNIACELLISNEIDIFNIYKQIEVFSFPKRTDCNNDEAQIWHTLSKALTQISIILYRLFSGTNRTIPLSVSDFDYLATNSLWLAQNWLQSASEHGITNAIPIKVVEQTVLNAFEELRLRKDNTNYLANDSLEITRLASLYKLKNETVLGLTNTAQHIYGYGWRKDITLNDVYEAIDACAKHDLGSIKNWIRRLTPFTTDIFEYSEKENRHIPTWRIKLIAKYIPERLADEFAYHITEHNWSLCQDVLDQIIINFPLNSAAEKALLLSQTTYESLRQMELRANESTTLKTILNEQLEFLGGFPPAPRDRSYSSDLSKTIEIDIEEYSPNRLNDLCDELKAQNIYSADDFITGWIDYWVDQNQAFDIIEAYEALLLLEDNFPDNLRRSLDKMFLLSCKLRGVKKSYPMALHSIRLNRLWSRFWGGKDTILIYAEKYKNDWQKFLDDTLSSKFSKTGDSEWFLVPTYELVKFFLVVGEHDLAVATTESMLECLEDETNHLSVTPLYWQLQELAIEQVPSHILLWFYKWPDRVARLRVAHQIAKLLENDVSFRSLFLQHLSQLQYEIDITDYLSILLLINGQIYSSEELTLAIIYPSILSNNILRKLGLLPKKVTSAFYTVKNEGKTYSDSDSDSDSFNKAQNGIAPLYLHFLQVLSKELNYPLLAHCEYEWECIKGRQDFIHFNYYGFCNNRFYPRDKLVFNIVTQAETVILSAYLRTLSYAYHCLGLSNAKASFFANQVKPFGTPYTSLQPSKAPTGWPQLLEIKKNEALPDKAALAKYMQNLINQEEKILFGSGPIIRTINGVCIDMELQVFQSSKKISLTPKEVFDALQYDIGRELGINPFSTRAHPLDVELGRFEVNYVYRGVETPSFTIGCPPAYMKTTSSSVDYYFGDVLNTKYKIWHYHWYPMHYAYLDPAMGAYLIVPEGIWNILRSRFENSIYMLGRLTIIDKRNYNKDDDPIKIYSMIEI